VNQADKCAVAYRPQECRNAIACPSLG
jgi:hypothetical protein